MQMVKRAKDYFKWKDDDKPPKRELPAKLKAVISAVIRFFRYYAVLLITPLIFSSFVNIVAYVTGIENPPGWFVILIYLSIFAAFFGWQAYFVFHDDTILKKYMLLLKEEKIDDSYKSALRFTLRNHHTYIDFLAIIVYFMSFGGEFLPVGMLVDAKAGEYFSVLFSSLIIILFVPSVIMILFLRALYLYRAAPAIKIFNFDEKNKRYLIRFLKDYFLGGVIYQFGPIIVVYGLLIAYILLKLMWKYRVYTVSAIIAYYFVVFVIAWKKRLKLTKRLRNVCERNGAKLKSGFFSRIPNLFFPARVYRISRDGKTYDAYLITVLSYRAHIRFYPGIKYAYGIHNISELSKKDYAIPLTPKFKINFKQEKNENHTNVIIVNPSCKFLDVKEGKTRCVTDLDVIYGTQILSGNSFVESIDRVMRGIHDFSGSGSFKY